MTALSAILGLAGVLLLLVGLVGGGFTFSGSVMPTVGRIARIPCFLSGGALLMTAVVLGLVEAGALNTEPPGPVDSVVAPVVVPTSEPGTLEPVDAATPAPADPTGYGRLMWEAQVYAAPDADADVLGTYPAGAPVSILCTTQGETMENVLGQTSSLWNRVDEGFIPDVDIDTGTVQAVAEPC